MTALQDQQDQQDQQDLRRQRSFLLLMGIPRTFPNGAVCVLLVATRGEAGCVMDQGH